jgi:hypothetical protein
MVGYKCRRPKQQHKSRSPWLRSLEVARSGFEITIGEIMMSTSFKPCSHYKALAAASILTLTATNVHAVGAVSMQDWDSGSTSLAPGSSLTAYGAAGNNSAFTDNPGLNYSSWAHTGAWWNFELTNSATTTVSISAQEGSDFWPGMSIWTSGSNQFDGGQTGFGGETSSAGFGTPHSFNSTGALGSDGTLWMQDGQGGNMLETLAYGVGNSAIAYAGGATGWGESVEFGVHDVSTSGTFTSGISGIAGDHAIDIVLADLAAGWYTIYVGGTNHTSGGGLYDLEVSAVPIPAAGLLFGSAVLGMMGIARRKNDAETVVSGTVNA